MGRVVIPLRVEQRGEGGIKGFRRSQLADTRCSEGSPAVQVGTRSVFSMIVMWYFGKMLNLFSEKADTVGAFESNALV